MTPHAREETRRRAQRQERLENAGILFLQVFAMFVVLLAVAASAVLFSGGSL